MKKFVLTVATLLMSFGIYAQSVNDVGLLSQHQLGGTARAMSMGTAFGALGGDFTSLSINPAGVGVFRSNQFVISPTLRLNEQDAAYFGTLSNATKTRLNFSNLGVTFHNPQKGGDWRGTSYAIGFNETVSYQTKQQIAGVNPWHSIVDYFAEAANRFGINGSLDASLADESVLIVPSETDSTFYVKNFAEGELNQSELRLSSGSQKEFLFALGANFKDQIYLGGSISIPLLSYKTSSVFDEADVDDLIPVYDQLTYTERIELEGYGLTGKFGLLVRPVKWLRVGAAYHLPTYYRIDERYEVELGSTFIDDAGVDEFATGLNDAYSYNLRTSGKWLFSLALVQPKLGLISFDYELVDYANAEYSLGSDLAGDAGVISSINQQINEQYQTASNFKVGAEIIRLKPLILRGGYSFSANPSKQNIFTSDVNSFSVGIGFAEKKFNLDFAFVRSISEDIEYAPYTFSGTDNTEDLARISSATNRFVVSFAKSF